MSLNYLYRSQSDSLKTAQVKLSPVLLWLLDQILPILQKAVKWSEFDPYEPK